jgi:acetyltransferase-like isoleucine patch superfamily enzyme
MYLHTHKNPDGKEVQIACVDGTNLIIGDNVTIFDGCFFEGDVTIEDDCVVYYDTRLKNVYLSQGSSIGNLCILRNAYLGKNSRVSNNSTVSGSAEHLDVGSWCNISLPKDRPGNYSVVARGYSTFAVGIIKQDSKITVGWESYVMHIGTVGGKVNFGSKTFIRQINEVTNNTFPDTFHIYGGSRYIAITGNDQVCFMMGEPVIAMNDGTIHLKEENYRRTFAASLRSLRAPVLNRARRAEGRLKNIK